MASHDIDEQQAYDWMFEMFIDYFRGKLSPEHLQRMNALPCGPKDFPRGYDSPSYALYIHGAWMAHVAREEGLSNAKAVEDFVIAISLNHKSKTTAEIIAEIRLCKGLFGYSAKIWAASVFNVHADAREM